MEMAVRTDVIDMLLLIRTGRVAIQKAPIIAVAELPDNADMSLCFHEPS